MLREAWVYVLMLLALAVSTQATHGDKVIPANPESSTIAPASNAVSQAPSTQASIYHGSGGSGQMEHRSTYNLLSEAMSQAVSNEFSSSGNGPTDGACHVDDLECFTVQDRLGMEAIRSLHRQLDDDDNGNIDLSESDDVNIYIL